MIHPCPTKASCLGTDTPFANLSAEQPDPDLFLASYFGWNFMPPPLGGSPAPVPSPFGPGPGTPGWCYAATPAQALACAATQNLTNNSSVVYYNAQISCPATCPDGTQFVWTILPGTYSAADQDTANSIAQSFACKLAFSNKICLSALSQGIICVGSNATASFSATGGALPLSFQIVSGSLPPGMSLVQTGPSSAAISGTPTAAGSYTFMVAAVDKTGNFMNKQYTVSVFGITDTPTAGTSGQPYTFQLTTTGGVAPYTFTLQSGAFPSGLSMSSSGLITGTPTTAGTSTAAILITDSNGVLCVGAVSITVSSSGPDWSTMVWDNVSAQSTGGRSPFILASGAVLIFNLDTTSGGGGVDFCTAHGSMTYTGGAANCKIVMSAFSAVQVFDFASEQTNPNNQLNVLFGGVGNGDFAPLIYQNGVVVNFTSFDAATATWFFPIAAGVNSLIEFSQPAFTVGFTNSVDGGIGNSAIALTATLGNV